MAEEPTRKFGPQELQPKATQQRIGRLTTDGTVQWQRRAKFDWLQR